MMPIFAHKTETITTRPVAHFVLQRKAAGHDQVSSVPPIVHDVLQSPSRPLDVTTRAFFEPRFGMDFSAVRLHTDEKAAQSARAVNALAYTAGRDIVFSEGQYRPSTTQGRELLAHELTHVAQQSASASKPDVTIGPVQSPAESEAEIVSRQVMSSANSSPASFGPRWISRSTVRISRTPLFDKDCHLQERCQLREAVRVSHLLLDAAIAELQPLASGSVKKGRVVDLLNVHFHDPSNVKGRARSVRKNYEKIKSELNSPFFRCHPPAEKCPETKETVTLAITDTWPGASISLCPEFWLRDCIDQGRVLIHEAFHHIAKMPALDIAYVHDVEKEYKQLASGRYVEIEEDEYKSLTAEQYVQLKRGEYKSITAKEYTERQRGKYESLTAAQAGENPDTYSQFALKVFPGKPGCNICNLTELGRIFGL